ncbi:MULTISPECIES: hypothetical protein [unclassified Paenibacillus]|uniref:hypothetical protein n=1 Tax=unclassified Paenibacillus TaxID=185978 RepID=UPI00070F9C87|nr:MULTISPECIES: hypothetical protein [unclassified Paenibacillus]KQX67983.1 hypothetical protein ASD40_26000 [Paenibacillus sp. Root444D2]KRE49431.1 hypothetical protein ASG85_24000 [Paenibacillus sp. Soil724D2]
MRGSVPYYIKKTNENKRSGPIRLAEEELHTSFYWFTFDEEMSAGRSANDMQHALELLAQLEGGAR